MYTSITRSCASVISFFTNSSIFGAMRGRPSPSMIKLSRILGCVTDSAAEPPKVQAGGCFHSRTRASKNIDDKHLGFLMDRKQIYRVEGVDGKVFFAVRRVFAK